MSAPETPAGGKPKHERRPVSFIVVLLTVLLSSAGLAVSGIIYTDHVAEQQRQDDIRRSQEICGLIKLFDDAYRQQQPGTELGRRVATEMHRYREALHCP